jgi:hypothetical protein
VKSTVTFKQFFYENMTSAGSLGGSSGGFSPNNISGSDFYAPGDARTPKGGAVYTRSGKLKKKKRRSSKSHSNKNKSKK